MPGLLSQVGGLLPVPSSQSQGGVGKGKGQGQQACQGAGSHVSYFLAIAFLQVNGVSLNYKRSCRRLSGNMPAALHFSPNPGKEATSSGRLSLPGSPVPPQARQSSRGKGA